MKKKIFAVLILVGIITCVIIYRRTKEPQPVKELDAINYNENKESLAIRHLDQRAYHMPSLVLYSVESKGTKKTLREVMPEYGFIPPLKGTADLTNIKYPLAIGFAESNVTDFMGSPIATINCAACHTGSIRVAGQVYIIDGSANLVNMSEWAKHVDSSITATMIKPIKIVETIARWKKVQKKADKLRNPYNPKLDSKELFELSVRMRDIVENDRQDDGIFKNGALILDDITKQEIVDDAHEYVIAQTILKGFKSEQNQTTEAYVEKIYQETIKEESARIKRLTNNKFDNAFTGQFMPSDNKNTDFKSYQDLVRDTLIKSNNFLKMLSILKEQKKNAVAVARECDDCGPGRDDAWYTLSRLVGEVPASNMKPGAPVKVPNLFNYAHYAKAYKQGKIAKDVKYRFHCDGNTVSILERNIMQGLALGAKTPDSGDILTEEKQQIYLDVDSLLKAENSYKAIEIPNFEDYLGKLDKKKVEHGKKIFLSEEFSHKGIKYTCASCHNEPAGKLVNIDLVETDRRRLYVFNSNNSLDNFDALTSKLRLKISNHYSSIGETVPTPNESNWTKNTSGYMARPLNGVWASPPYLHNGSVRTLWELLKRPEEREEFFFMGTRNFDVKDVGYKSEEFYIPLGETAPKNKEGVKIKAYKQQNLIKMNEKEIRLNKGHDFGTDFTDVKKRALIEYIKSLGEPFKESKIIETK